ncbi:hypothetical protein [Porticoccus sp.]
MADSTQKKAVPPSERFFAIGREEFHRVCELGMNAACLYLVQACGSGRDNIKTNWSRNALSTYTSISRSRAIAAQNLLLGSTPPLIRQTKKGKHPWFQFIRNDDSELVWLPTTFIVGAADETPPLECIRQTGDVMILLLAIDIYAETNIADEGGMPRTSFFREFKKTVIASRGAFEIYGFSGEPLYTCYHYHPIVKPHVKTNDGKARCADFFSRIGTLMSLGLFSFVPTVFESDEGAPLFPLVDPFSGDRAPSEILNFAFNSLPEEYEHVLDEHDFILAFPRHFTSVMVASVLVPKYRQHTSITAAGYAETRDRFDHWQHVYEQSKPVADEYPAISREYQGHIKGYSRANQR